jgi:CDGSH-type Zn-finger protein
MDMAKQTKITTLDNGPYLVKDPVVVDADCNEFPSKRETVALCRCGGSTTKPVYDGIH